MTSESTKSGDPTACSPGDLSKAIKSTTFENTKLNTVKLDWKEVYYTNCPLVSASNVDQELGWTREEFKKIGVKYAFMRSVRENDWYPHYIHNLDNLIRFGGLFPPIHVHADIRRTKLLGLRRNRSRSFQERSALFRLVSSSYPTGTWHVFPP